MKTYYGNLVSRWPEAGQVSVLDNSSGQLINPRWPILKWLPACFALRQKIKQEKIDHVIVGHILPLGTATLICSWFSKIKYSVILHGMDLALAMKQSRKKWLANKILNRAEKIVCTNSYVAELARQAFPGVKQKVAVVNPGVENRATRNPQLATGLKEKFDLQNKIILLSVGRLVKRKGFDKVIEAIPKVLEKVPNLAYIILGEGKEFENCKLKIENFRSYIQILHILGVGLNETFARFNIASHQNIKNLICFSGVVNGYL